MRRLGDAKRWIFSPACARRRQTSSTFNHTQTIQAFNVASVCSNTNKGNFHRGSCLFVCAYERTVRTQPV